MMKYEVANKEEYKQWLDKIKGQKRLSSGFDNLDKLLGDGIRPQLYCIGAQSSCGKTTMMLQMANYMAEHGQPVLYIALEQSDKDLITKSISRLSKEDTYLDIMNGIGTHPDAIERYFECINDNMIIHSNFDGQPDINNILEIIMHYKDLKPVVFIDYMQLIGSNDPKKTDKQVVDLTMYTLKSVVKKLEIPVFLISSLNRGSYEKKDMSFADFKESSNIEFQSDVVLGLQYRERHCEDFNINVAKKEPIRKLECTILKNRMGQTGECFFDFIPDTNTFIEF